MSLKNRVAGHVSNLLRRNHKLRKSEGLIHYCHLLVQRQVLEEAMLSGKMDERRWRALTEVDRAIIDLGRSLAVIDPPPKAGTKPEDEDNEPAPPKIIETNKERRARVYREAGIELEEE